MEAIVFSQWGLRLATAVHIRSVTGNMESDVTLHAHTQQTLIWSMEKTTTTQQGSGPEARDMESDASSPSTLMPTGGHGASAASSASAAALDCNVALVNIEVVSIDVP